MSVNTKTYDSKFFAKYSRNPWKKDGPKLADAIAATVKPRSVIDLGCGTGRVIHHLKMDHGVRVWGIEGSKEARPYLHESVQECIQIADLTSLLVLPTCDVSICLEVAEHVPEEFSAILVQNCTRCASKYVVFSAAPPGQGGKGHINCKPWEYWEGLFSECNFTLHPNKTGKIRALLAGRHASKWYSKNTRVLRKV